MKTVFNFLRIGYGISSDAAWNREFREPFNRLHIPLAKSAVVSIGGKSEFFLRTGKAYLLPSHVNVCIGGEDREEYEHIYVDFYVSPIVLNKALVEIDISKDPIFKDFSDMLYRRLLSINKGRYVELEDFELPRYANYFLRSFMSYIFDSYEVDQITNEKLADAISYIYSHYSGNIGNDDIANSIGVQQRQLIRLFKEELNMTPHQFLTEYRINMAINMLSEGMPIKEVCYKCGFEDRNTFRKAFKRINFIPPSEYAALVNGKKENK